MRRLIVSCDGTWQSALYQEDPRKYTNNTRLDSSFNRQDTRHSPPIEQIKLYVPGLGTGQELMIGAMSAALGEGCTERVREAYYWLCQNYEAGDEIHLYGFSRGGYLARLLASLISLVGLLHRSSSLLPELFSILLSKRSLETKRGRRQYDALTKLVESDEIQQRKQDQIRARPGGFLVQVLGLFETVPLFHLHTIEPGKDLERVQNPFGLSDCDLEPEIERVFQALAVSEVRPSYAPLILKRDTKNKGQELLQVWFPGCHSDVGGGDVSDHDLADISLDFMVGHIKDYVSLNIEYIAKQSSNATAPWGSHKPHESVNVAIRKVPRHPPHGTDDTTFQHLHRSILEQNPLDPPADLRPLLEISDHEVFLPLTLFERERKATWPVQPAVPVPEPLPLSAQSPSPSSPRIVREAPTVFHAAGREAEEKEGNVVVANSLAGHTMLRRGFDTAVTFERNLVSGFQELRDKARGAGDRL